MKKWIHAILVLKLKCELIKVNKIHVYVKQVIYLQVHVPGNKSMPSALVVAPDMYTYLLKYFKSSKLHRVSEWKLNYP